MRVSLSTYGSRGDVEPLVGLAVRLRELGAEVRVCAPPDEEFAVRLRGLDAEVRVCAPPTEEFAERPAGAARNTDRARARAVAGAVRTGGATVAATLLPDAVSRERPPVSA
ncbi:hypothetical protein [Streptosporangium minutum]|uniref:Glycosyl transferase n=1 Tax=Streptosporangium minutum TaxID=569862 RepID=A0A243RL27_9ACTN|nr:hypothetical protein [Streptosporangium minutum]OUC94926.1 hypothetical protein CA984_20680 [Streptosporangium minutum]